MAVSKKANRLTGQEKIFVGIRFREHVVVFIGDRTVDELGLRVDAQRTDGQAAQVIPVGFGKHRAGPVNRPAGVGVELICLVEARRDAIMVPANTWPVQVPNDIDGLYGIRSVSDDVSAAEDRVVSGLFRTSYAGLKRFQVGVDVTQYEIAHGMMVCMRLQKIMGFSMVLALLTAAAAGLSALNERSTVASPASIMISRFVVVLVFGGLGLAVARESQLKGSLFIGSEEWSLTLRDLLNYGVLPGLVLGLINYFFFFPYRYSPFVTPRIREMSSVYDSFVISLDSGMAEEIVYRLFILSCFLFSFRHLYSRLAPLWPGVVSVLPMALSVVLSSLLFAMVHNVYSFTAAFFGGILLGFIYMKSGIESAIAAHFCANFLFFSASYLS